MRSVTFEYPNSGIHVTCVLTRREHKLDLEQRKPFWRAARTYPYTENRRAC